jgi:hypothetical protein
MPDKRNGEASRGIARIMKMLSRAKSYAPRVPDPDRPPPQEPVPGGPEPEPPPLPQPGYPDREPPPLPIEPEMN